MPDPPRYWRLAARCPRCKHQPAERYSESAVEHAKRAPLDEEFANVRCRCGCVYRIAWVALAYAEPVVDARAERPPWAA